MSRAGAEAAPARQPFQPHPPGPLRRAGRWRLPKASSRCSAPWLKPSRRARRNRNQKPAAAGAARIRAIFFRAHGAWRHSGRGLPPIPPPASSCRKPSTGYIGSTAIPPATASMTTRPIQPGIIFRQIPSPARAFAWPTTTCPHLRARNRRSSNTRTKPMPSAASARSMAAILNAGVARAPACAHCGAPYTGKIKVFVDRLIAFGGGTGGFLLEPRERTAAEIAEGFSRAERL